jgi:phosphatidylglycerophosphatase A
VTTQGVSTTGWLGKAGLFVATFGYLGYVPVAPGTAGSVIGLAVFWAIRASGSAGVELATILFLLLAGVWSSTSAERYFGRTDPSHVVIDEVAGMLITLAFIPVGVCGVLIGFVVFRVLDIVKPWPARRFERLQGGVGIMADDVMAAVYGNLILRGLVAVAPGWLL